MWTMGGTWLRVPRTLRVHGSTTLLVPKSLSRHGLGPSSVVFVFVPKAKANSGRIRAMAMEESGVDTDGHSYSTRQEMWCDQVGEEAKKLDWYTKGVAYWEGIEASVDGVLGGYGHVNKRDIETSKAFLREVMSEVLPDVAALGRHLVALDCGAGVGRITKNLLLHHFHEVDLVEPASHFLEAAMSDLKSSDSNRNSAHKAVNFFCSSLQDFVPEQGRYDVIWVQWCIGHLTDEDFIAFFERAKSGLKQGGFFVLKENIAKNGFVLDKVDRSITRSDAYFRDLFKQAGLHLYKTKVQKGFPQELFSVRMYALQASPPVVTPPVTTRSKRQAVQPRVIY